MSMKISNHLSKKENWTPELIWVHRTRFILGVILGFCMGFSLCYCFVIIMYYPCIR